MMFDDIQQGGSTPEVLKYVLTALGFLITNALTYWISRNKNKSEVDKNHADTTKTRVETIGLLLKEVDEMILTTKQLRSEIDVRADERLVAVSLIKKMITEAGELIDLTIKTGSVQAVRMKSVGISESLYKLRDFLDLQGTLSRDPSMSQVKGR